MFSSSHQMDQPPLRFLFLEKYEWYESASYRRSWLINQVPLLVQWRVANQRLHMLSRWIITWHNQPVSQQTFQPRNIKVSWILPQHLHVLNLCAKPWINSNLNTRDAPNRNVWLICDLLTCTLGGFDYFLVTIRQEIVEEKPWLVISLEQGRCHTEWESSAVKLVWNIKINYNLVHILKNSLISKWCG